MAEPRPVARLGVLPWLSALGFLILAAAIAFLWLRRAPTRADASLLAGVNNRLDQLAGELATINQKLVATETKLVALPAPPDLAPIEARLSALEKRSPPAATPPNPAEMGAAVAPLADRIDAVGKALAELKARLGKTEHVARIAAAAIALEQGRPLGNLPDAPPALARFATKVPPTLAGLRLSFPNAARAERAAARPTGAGQSFLNRILLRLGTLFTLRQGNRVIIGNPADAALSRAQDALDVGDLASALAALASLSPPLAPAMLAWEDQASALLAAEGAMATMASSG